MAFGQNPTTSTQSALANNQFPIGSVAVPGNANGDLTALEGGPVSTDTNGNKTAPVSMYVKDGGNVTQGASTDPNTANTVMGRLTKIRDILLGLIGQQTKANSLSVTIASDENALPVSGTVAISGTVPVSGTFYQATQPVSGTVGVSNFPATQPVSGSVSVSNLPSEQSVNLNQVNGTALSTSNPVPTQVQNFPATQPVSGTVTANAGTNLNTSALALEGGNLSTLVAKIPNQGAAAKAASMPVTMATDQPPMPVTLSTTIAGEDIPNNRLMVSPETAQSNTNTQNAVSVLVGSAGTTNNAAYSTAIDCTHARSYAMSAFGALGPCQALLQVSYDGGNTWQWHPNGFTTSAQFCLQMSTTLIAPLCRVAVVNTHTATQTINAYLCLNR